MKAFKSILEFQNHFNTEEKCREFLEYDDMEQINDFAQSELRDQLIEYHKFLDHEEKDDMSEIENNVDIFLTK